MNYIIFKRQDEPEMAVLFPQTIGFMVFFALIGDWNVVACGLVEHSVRGVRCTRSSDAAAFSKPSRGDIDAMLIEKQFGVGNDEMNDHSYVPSKPL
jgi:hypothetical protein